MTTLLTQAAFSVMLSVCPTYGTTPECATHATQLRVYANETKCNQAAARMLTVGGDVIGFDQALCCVRSSY